MMLSSLQVHDHQLIFQIISGVGQFHHWQKRGEESWPKKKNSCCFSKHIYAHCFFGRQQLLPYITKQVVIAVVVVEASETYQSSIDQELGA